MKKLTLKLKKGFTLLEIIIVVIIVGVLASLALPRLFGTVEYSRSAEALASIGTIRSSMERCLLRNGNGNYARCTSFTTQLDIPNPGSEAGAHFAYSFPTASSSGYIIRAIRNTLDNGTSGDQVNLTVNVGGTITKNGTTAFGKL
jgi:prepilin-type N-terminal cleavage/methylation domain-containing protein